MRCLPLLALLMTLPACEAEPEPTVFQLDPLPGVTARDCDLAAELAAVEQRWPRPDSPVPTAATHADLATSQAVLEAARDAVACDHTTDPGPRTWDAAQRIRQASADLAAHGEPMQAAEAGIVLLRIGARLRSDTSWGGLMMHQIQPLGAEAIRDLAPALDADQRAEVADAVETARVPDHRMQDLFVDAALYRLRPTRD